MYSYPFLENLALADLKRDYYRFLKLERVTNTYL